ncbi:MAG: DUF5937 family protein [Lapillicoccus sp.]
MIQLRLSAADLGRLRFAYSPLAEIAESLSCLGRGQAPAPLRGWLEATRPLLGGLDVPLLHAVVPPHLSMPSFFFTGSRGPGSHLDRQLEDVMAISPQAFREDLLDVWGGHQVPAVLEALLAEDDGGARHLAAELAAYWAVALAPHWSRMRAVLDADVAYRAGRLTTGGIEALLADLHPELSLHGYALHIDKPRWSNDEDLTGAGLVLVPSVFSWPNLIVETGMHGLPSLTYGARGVATLWESDAPDDSDEEALGALLGRSRAAVLVAVGLPRSTSELAVELQQSPPAVSAHLSVLRRCGLVRSWRSGRRVLYERTPLATSILLASGTSDQETTTG